MFLFLCCRKFTAGEQRCKSIQVLIYFRFDSSWLTSMARERNWIYALSLANTPSRVRPFHSPLYFLFFLRRILHFGSFKSCYSLIAIIWLQKYLDFILNWLSCFHHSTCDIIPKLSINMETYPHLVSSQIPHILLYTFIQYKNNHCVLNILYSAVKTLAAGIILPINNITKN